MSGHSLFLVLEAVVGYNASSRDVRSDTPNRSREVTQFVSAVVVVKATGSCPSSRCVFQHCDHELAPLPAMGSSPPYGVPS